MEATASGEQVTLYYREGSNDKVYQAAIEPSGVGFVVNIAYGRRGSTLLTGTKTSSPVDYPSAKKIYDKLIRVKNVKGYTQGDDGTPYQETDRENRVTDIRPQLLNPIELEAAERLLADSDWHAQEKLDGKRVLVRRVGDQIDGINRNGLVIGLPEPIVRFAKAVGSQQWLMDGEAVGNGLIVFDLLESACRNLRSEPYAKRLKALAELLGESVSGPIRLIQTSTTRSAKKSLLQNLQAQKKEGIVFKQRSAPYIPGRPASGGDQLKLKFTATASCIVASINGSRRSVKLELLDGSRHIGVGNVTIPPNHAIPGMNTIVEVRYLYAYPGGSLYQPVYLGVRDDVQLSACTFGQLKFKTMDQAE